MGENENVEDVLRVIMCENQYKYMEDIFIRVIINSNNSNNSKYKYI